MRVLGTPLEQAHDDDRARTVLLSDLHVPLAGGQVLDDLTTVLQDARQRAAATRVLILGDLFDALTGPKQLTLGAHREVVARLRACTAAGVSVTVLHGNRDFMLDAQFGRLTGARVVPGGLRFRLGTRSCLALHGDELCLRDLPYQKSKRWLRHWLTKLTLRHLPLAAALRIAARVRAKSMQTGQRGDPARFDPAADALRAVESLGVDLLVFGHIHKPGRGWFQGLEYCVLPAFDQVAACLVGEGSALEFAQIHGAALPVYGAHQFR